MAASTSAHRGGHAAIRQLKWLVVLLVLSNIAIGFFAVYALRQADKRYSDLLDRSVPVMNDLQTLTARAMQAMAATNPTRVEKLGSDAITEARKAMAADVALRQSLLAQSWLTDDKPKRGELMAAGASFTDQANAVITAFEHNDTQAAKSARERELRTAFDRYIDAITTAADELETESQRVSDLETAHTSSLSRLVLGFAAWPVLAIITLLVITALFVFVLMFLFRGREMNDMP